MKQTNLKQKKTIATIYDFLSDIQYLTQWRSLTEAFGYRFKLGSNSREGYITEFEKYWKDTHRQVFKLVGAKKKSFGIDIGSGNGELLDTARDMGIEMVGLTLSEDQKKYCEAKGSTVDVLSYTDPLFVKKYKNKADFVTLIGPVEHFTDPYKLIEAAKQQPNDPGLINKLRRKVYLEMYEQISKVLKPGGKIYISCFVFNRVTMTPQEITRNPFVALLHGGMDYFHFSLIHHSLFGYPPDKDMLAQTAIEQGDFKVIFEEDGTKDYHHTSRYWWYLVYQVLYHKPWSFVKHSLEFLFQNPPHALITLITFFTASWPWLFDDTKGESPAVLERLVLEKIKK